MMTYLMLKRFAYKRFSAERTKYLWPITHRIYATVSDNVYNSITYNRVCCLLIIQRCLIQSLQAILIYNLYSYTINRFVKSKRMGNGGRVFNFNFQETVWRSWVQGKEKAVECLLVQSTNIIYERKSSDDCLIVETLRQEEKTRESRKYSVQNLSLARHNFKFKNIFRLQLSSDAQLKVNNTR